MTHPVIRRRLIARRGQYCILPTPKDHSGHLEKMATKTQVIY